MSYEYGFVNGNSCSYARLGRYNNCANAQKTAVPKFATDYVEKPALATAAQTAAAVSLAETAPVSSLPISTDGAITPAVAPVAATQLPGVNVEGYAEANFVPSYTVPNYPPITTVSLTHGNTVPGCGGYFNILDAYGGMSGQNTCTTNFINN